LVLAPIFAQALYLALSRRREYLADASGALFTRYPEGLARALEKISVGPAIKDDSRVTAPLYIVRPGRLGTTSFLGGTHPPVEDRIRILRGMGRGAGWRAYDASYRVVKGRGVISVAALERADDPEARALGPSPVETPRARARAASNALFRAAGYAPRVCGACHATLRIPPALAASLVNCPRCSAPLPPAPLPSPSAPG
jgi:heat shock protein HtpX